MWVQRSWLLSRTERCDIVSGNQTNDWIDSIVGFGIILGSAIGATIGLIFGGGAGLALGIGFGAAGGLVLGAIARSLYEHRN